MTKLLIANKRFLPLVASHFLSVINDSFIRTVFLFFVTYKMTQDSPAFIICAGLLFAACFCVGSVLSGQIADKISKTRFLIFLRIAEAGIMLLALVSVALGSKLLLTLVLATLGLTSAGLRATVYALLPQLVRKTQLNRGNVWIKSAGILAMGCAGLLLLSVLKFDAAYPAVCGFAFILSLVSLALTFRLPYQPPVDPRSVIVKNPIHVFDFVAQSLKYQFNRWAYLVGIAWFWMIMSLILLFSAEYGHSVLHARWSVVMFLSAGVFAAGYLLGSFVYLRLSRRHALGTHTAFIGCLVSLVLADIALAGYALAPLAVPKAITVAQLLTTNIHYWRIVADTAFLGALAALYITPFYTLIQRSTPAPILGRVMSFSSMLNALGIASMLVIVLALSLLSFNVADILLLAAAVNVGAALYMVRLLPMELRRKFFKKVLTLLFRVKVEGLENLEKAGKRALIVVNHTSYLDVLLISAFIPKNIVFSISNRLIDKTLVKFMTNLATVKPLDPHSPFAVKDMAEELRQDKLCMIFTEGLIEGGNTRMKIYEGPAMMAVKGRAPVLPIRIDGAKYTFFSRVLGKKAEFRFFPQITLTIKPPVSFDFPDELTTRENREQSSSRLYDILSDMAFESCEIDKPVFIGIAQAMKMAGRFKPVLEDTERKPVKFFAAFMKAFILGRLINRQLPDERFVGVMVPTSNTCALTVLGLHAFGKVPAMINFTSGPKQVVATAQTVGLKTIVTAHKVVLLAKLEALIAALEEAGLNILYLEDLKGTLRTRDKLFGIGAGFFPQAAYRKTTNRAVDPNEAAAILFTSGSEGMPKAVFLTHRNLLANAYQVPARVDVLPTDIFLNCLPMFHSFGLGAGTFLPLLMGVKTVLYPTPLHYRIIPEICASVKATVFFGTDTFLAGYAKCANPYDFNSLRIVAAGAEKLKDETRKIWSEKFGVRLLEGYGTTECSPFVSVNTFLHQRKDSVGRFFPGIVHKLKTVEGIKEGKELWVKGPNIMKGYMRFEKPLTLDPPKDGWYDTGDIVTVDADGYIFIKGRCKRFAKIGGEMVSLLAVEQLIDKHWSGFVSAAVNVSDPKKGEQIVLITTCTDITKDKLINVFKNAGASELSIPSKIITTENPPLLGTGKIDYVGAKELALKEVAK